jgi:hypothetical protein
VARGSGAWQHLGCDVEDDLDALCVHLVCEARRDGRAEVDAVRLDQVKDARVAQAVVPLGGVRELVENDHLPVG